MRAGADAARRRAPAFARPSMVVSSRAVGLRRRNQARHHRLPVQPDRAGAALALGAALFRPRQPGILAQGVEQRLVARVGACDRRAVDGRLDDAVEWRTRGARSARRLYPAGLARPAARSAAVFVAMRRSASRDQPAKRRQRDRWRIRARRRLARRRCSGQPSRFGAGRRHRALAAQIILGGAARGRWLARRCPA